MSRHSKNNTAGSVFTYHERQRTGYGTQKVRLGKDSLAKFGCCGLCLSLARRPVASPSGYIYCKECIYKNMLEQKEKLKGLRTAYETQMADEEADTKAAADAKQATKLAHFASKATPLTSADEALFQSKAKLSKHTLMEGKEEETKADAARADLSRQFVAQSEAWSREAVKRTSFWTPDNAPEAKAPKLQQPDKLPRDPLSGKFLKLKHLIPVHFRLDKAEDGSPTRSILCAVSAKPIIHQDVVLLKPCVTSPRRQQHLPWTMLTPRHRVCHICHRSGELIIKSAFNSVVKKSMTCPITGKRLRSSDIIALQAGGTGFASHNKVEASVYRPPLA